MSKTTVANPAAGFTTLTVKSVKSKLESPFTTDKQMLMSEVSRMTKDETRINFSTLVGSLPCINPRKTHQKPTTKGGSLNRVRRKASIPSAAKASRLNQSLGSVEVCMIGTEASTMTDGGNIYPQASVTKESKGSAYPSYFYNPKENLFESKRGSRYESNKPRAFHLTQPDSNLAKFVFLNQGQKRPQFDSQSQHAYASAPQNQLHSNASIPRSPHSQAPQKNSAYKRGFLMSNHSIDSDNTIQNFLMKDSCGVIVKTKKMIEREQDRVEKVRRARENALQIAMEKSAKLILKERRYESNAKRHEKMVEVEGSYRAEKFQQVNDKRYENKQRTIEHDTQLNELGFERYKSD